VSNAAVSTSSLSTSTSSLESRKRCIETFDDSVDDEKPTYFPTPLAVLAKVTQPPR
jgi:hypothetical protein